MLSSDFRTASACFGSTITVSCGIHQQLHIIDLQYSIKPENSPKPCEFAVDDCTWSVSQIPELSGYYQEIELSCNGFQQCSVNPSPQTVAGTNCSSNNTHLMDYAFVQFLCVPRKDDEGKKTFMY